MKRNLLTDMKRSAYMHVITATMKNNLKVYQKRGNVRPSVLKSIESNAKLIETYKEDSLLRPVAEAVVEASNAVLKAAETKTDDDFLAYEFYHLKVSKLCLKTSAKMESD